MDVTLSVVVPVYNVELYIDKCLSSLRAMPSHCEAIFVDDGSTDGSVRKIEGSCQKQLASGQFRLLHTVNRGIGPARNLGTREARGRRIAFVDSDDYVLDDFFEKILGVIDRSDADIIQFNALRVTGDDARGYVAHCHTLPSGEYELNQIRNHLFAQGRWWAWARVFTRELLLKYPFASEKVAYEDLNLMPFIYMQSLRIYLLSDALYAYRDNTGSITANHNEKDLFDLMSLYRRLINLPDGPPATIVRLQVARTITYFVYELGVDNRPLLPLVADVQALQNKAFFLRLLKKGDLAFLLAPRIYCFLERFRHLISRGHCP